MRIIPTGGRIKSAGCGMAHLYEHPAIPANEQALADLRAHPIPELLSAFFPSDSARLRHMLRGIGFYRPVLKTDQGMAGNFLGFRMATDLAMSDLAVRTIAAEEGLALPEAWCNEHDPGVVRRIQQAMLPLNLHEAAPLLEVHYAARERTAERGRTPFFFIRPARLDQPMVFGRDMMIRAQAAVTDALAQLERHAAEQEERLTGKVRPLNLLYCQPDAYVLRTGEVVVEKINLPDVGFFLTEIDYPSSRILPEIQDIVRELRAVVCQTLARLGKRVAILTRNEVLDHNEDMLERWEIASIEKGLRAHGTELTAYPVRAVEQIPTDTPVILLNLNYQDPGIAGLLDRHTAGDLACYPNPFAQMAAREVSGLESVTVPPKMHERFLQLTSSDPKNDASLEHTLTLIDRLLSKDGLRGDILHADIGSEIVPVSRRTMHSWRQLARRVRRDDRGVIRLRSVPAHSGNLLVTSTTGPRLHVFRFMCVS